MLPFEDKPNFYNILASVLMDLDPEPEEWYSNQQKKAHSKVSPAHPKPQQPESIDDSSCCKRRKSSPSIQDCCVSTSNSCLCRAVPDCSQFTKVPQTSTPKSKTDRFTSHQFDLKPFEPSEITVKLEEDGRTLVVNGSHTSEKDGHYESHQYTRKVVLPENVQIEGIRCKLDQDGQLQIDVPYKHQEAIDTNRMIPVEFVSSSSKLSEPKSETESEPKSQETKPDQNNNNEPDFVIEDIGAE